MVRNLYVSLALLVVALLQGCTTTVLTAPCNNPKVSNSSVPFVYLVMLPYIFRGSDAPSDDYQSAVDALNDVARLQAVRMGAETTDMHVTLLADAGTDCGIESVYRSFTDNRLLERELRSTVVFFWGEVFERNDQLLVQSHTRMLWKNPQENLVETFAAVPGETARLKFVGSLPTSTVSFPSRSLPLGLLPGSGGELRHSLEARSGPAATANKVPLPKKFTIQRREGNWVELLDAEGPGTAWVAVTDPGTRARSILPELSFAHALAAYANYSRASSSRIADNAIQWFEEFRAAFPPSAADESLQQPLAVANAVEAYLRIDKSLSQSEREGAGKLMDRAVAGLPTNSAMLNLAAVLKVEQCCATRADAAEIQQRFETARRLDVGNQVIAKNLLNWYTLLEQKDESLLPVPREELRRRLAQLKQLLE